MSDMDKSGYASEESGKDVYYRIEEGGDKKVESEKEGEEKEIVG